MNIKSKLQTILPQVQSPARYLGGEANSIHKDPSSVRASMALVFPDTYEVGMSNNGMKVLYHNINRVEHLYAEMAFTPWLDMVELMRSEGIPLYTHATWSPVSSFDAIGISVQTELNFTNIPLVLELAGLSPWAKERTDKDPIIIGGGPCMANPEPIAEFFDLFIIGDGEEANPKVLDRIGQLKAEKKSKIEILEDLAQIEGVYVPALVSMEQNTWGEWVPAKPASGSYKNTSAIKRTFIPEMQAEQYPTKNIIPNMQPVHPRFSVEVQRGCTQGCRFCQAGYWYRPSRELSPDQVVEIAQKGISATGEKELGLLSLSTADYSQVEPVTDLLIDKEFFHGIDVSLPSLRVNSFGESLATKVQALKGGRSATFAPETGSERLRKMINKTISDQDMYDAAHNVFKAGFNQIKLYTMIGLPTENLDDMESFCQLIEKLVEIGRQYKGNNRVHASVGVLIPKPFTPMQWVSFMDQEKVEKHLWFVRERFYKNPKVRISWAAWDTSHLEAFYSRGDRSLAPMIYEAYQKGLIFESFHEQFSYETWQEIWEKHQYNPEIPFRERSFEEVFPWDFLHPGVTKGYLQQEYKKMFLTDSEPVPNCKWGDCQHCGIPGNGLDTQLVDPPQEPAPSRSPEEIQEVFQERRNREYQVYAYRINFNKADVARFLPHHDTLDFFKRSLNALQIPMHYSQGFNPKPKVKNSGALPLGIDSRCEEIVIELRQELPRGGSAYRDLMASWNQKLPEGLDITQWQLLKKAKLTRATAVEYRFEGEWDTQVLTAWKEGALPNALNHRGKEIVVQDEVLALETGESGELIVKARTNNEGNTISPFVLFSSLLGKTEVECRLLHLIKSQRIIE